MNPLKFKGYFDEILQELFHKSGVKGSEYSRNEDRLHNFRRGAIMQGLSIMKYLDTLRSKHEISIKDMIDDYEEGICHSKEAWKEKITDDILYLILLYAMARELEDQEGNTQ